jgi:peptide/nickel transport system ATP-binding protein
VSEDVILSVKGLYIEIQTSKGSVSPVRGIDFSLRKGESVCLVGESGCGKSVTALSLLNLLPDPPFRIAHGEIILDDTDITKLSPAQLCSIRGRKLAMIFQEPMTALNPVFSIGEQIAEAVYTHITLPRKQIQQHVIKVLRQAGIPSAEDIMSQYPHQLSGGLRQRAMIAMALACDPKLLVADEPTTALDVTIQAQILELLNSLMDQQGLGLLLITHNLGVVAQIAQRVLIMYAGKIMEESGMEDLFDDPLHPYSKALLASVPYGLGEDARRLTSIPGSVPTLDSIPPGCPFQDRCPSKMDICRTMEPEYSQISEGRRVMCHLYS